MDDEEEEGLEGDLHNGLHKGNLTDVDSADLDREDIMLGKEEESMLQSAHASNMYFH